MASSQLQEIQRFLLLRMERLTKPMLLPDLSQRCPCSTIVLSRRPNEFQNSSVGVSPYELIV